MYSPNSALAAPTQHGPWRADARHAWPWSTAEPTQAPSPGAATAKRRPGQRSRQRSRRTRDCTGGVGRRQTVCFRRNQREYRREPSEPRFFGRKRNSAATARFVDVHAVVCDRPWSARAGPSLSSGKGTIILPWCLPWPPNAKQMLLIFYVHQPHAIASVCLCFG